MTCGGQDPDMHHVGWARTGAAFAALNKLARELIVRWNGPRDCGSDNEPNSASPRVFRAAGFSVLVVNSSPDQSDPVTQADCRGCAAWRILNDCDGGFA